MASSKEAAVLQIDGHEVRVSNPEKPYFAERGIRKIDVVEYFVAVGSAPIVVVGITGVPVTPLPGAEDLAADLTAGVLVVWQGQGHTAYPKTPCVTDAVNAYLIDLTAPQDGLTCPA